jgi:hypothetical protein
MVKAEGAKEVRIKISLLRKIADYYEFPLAVFFAPESRFKGTRKSEILKRANKFNRKFKKIYDEFMEE